MVFSITLVAASASTNWRPASAALAVAFAALCSAASRALVARTACHAEMLVPATSAVPVTIAAATAVLCRRVHFHQRSTRPTAHPSWTQLLLVKPTRVPHK